jgi:transposase
MSSQRREEMYDNFIALDWSKSNMAISRMTNKSDNIKTIDVPSDIGELKIYLSSLRGTKILTTEESTSAQWLYVELRKHLDKIIICDPYRNRLLSEGPKNDKIDSKKLVKILRANLLKEVYHSTEDVVELRKLVSGYEDIVKTGVRFKNQKDALFRSVNKNSKQHTLESATEKFILDGIDKNIKIYEEEKKRYEERFNNIVKQYPMIKLLKSLPGIGNIHAVKIFAKIITAKRFQNAGCFLSYCGLVKLKRMSGGVVYGSKYSRYSRTLKCVFSMAACSCLQQGRNNPMKEYYYYLVETKRLSDKDAKQAIKRRLATLCYGILKSGQKYDPYRWRKTEEKEKKQDQ